nr:hypothetical protein Iba_chr13bCG6460 [Ipomoea batatas]
MWLHLLGCSRIVCRSCQGGSLKRFSICETWAVKLYAESHRKERVSGIRTVRHSVLWRPTILIHGKGESNVGVHEDYQDINGKTLFGQCTRWEQSWYLYAGNFASSKETNHHNVIYETSTIMYLCDRDMAPAY